MEMMVVDVHALESEEGWMVAVNFDYGHVFDDLGEKAAVTVCVGVSKKATSCRGI